MSNRAWRQERLAYLLLPPAGGQCEIKANNTSQKPRAFQRSQQVHKDFPGKPAEISPNRPGLGVRRSAESGGDDNPAAGQAT